MDRSFTATLDSPETKERRLSMTLVYNKTPTIPNQSVFEMGYSKENIVSVCFLTIK